MAKNDIKVDWATNEAAKYACENWHYSKCLPIGKLVKVGVWEHGKFIGVVIFSRGTARHLVTRFGLKMEEGCELTRVAMTRHRVQVSRVMRIALLFLKAKCPTIKLVVSFASEAEGHHGGIYQAGNWIYEGRSATSQDYYYNGRKVPSRTVNEVASKANLKVGDLLKTGAVRKASAKGKHRYLMPLDKELMTKLQLTGQKYPKREK